VRFMRRTRCSSFSTKWWNMPHYCLQWSENQRAASTTGKGKGGRKRCQPPNLGRKAAGKSPRRRLGRRCLIRLAEKKRPRHPAGYPCEPWASPDDSRPDESKRSIEDRSREKHAAPNEVFRHRSCRPDPADLGKPCAGRRPRRCCSRSSRVSRNPLRTPGPLLPRPTSRSSAGRPLR
jgi:hypothetical protein